MPLTAARWCSRLSYGGEGQLTNSNRSFGQGAAGFGRYWGAADGDFVIGDYMTEGYFVTFFTKIRATFGAAPEQGGPG